MSYNFTTTRTITDFTTDQHQVHDATLQLVTVYHGSNLARRCVNEGLTEEVCAFEQYRARYTCTKNGHLRLVGLYVATKRYVGWREVTGQQYYENRIFVQMRDALIARAQGELVAA